MSTYLDSSIDCSVSSIATKMTQVVILSFQERTNHIWNGGSLHIYKIQIHASEYTALLDSISRKKSNYQPDGKLIISQ